MIEPGTPEGFRQINGRPGLPFWIGALPCQPLSHEKSCPRRRMTGAIFPAGLPAARLHRQLKGGDAPYEDEKFCYLAFGRAKGRPGFISRNRHAILEPESGKITLEPTHAVRACYPAGAEAGRHTV